MQWWRRRRTPPEQPLAWSAQRRGASSSSNPAWVRRGNRNRRAIGCPSSSFSAFWFSEAEACRQHQQPPHGGEHHHLLRTRRGIRIAVIYVFNTAAAAQRPPPQSHEIEFFFCGATTQQDERRRSRRGRPTGSTSLSTGGDDLVAETLDVHVREHLRESTGRGRRSSPRGRTAQRRAGTRDAQRRAGLMWGNAAPSKARRELLPPEGLLGQRAHAVLAQAGHPRRQAHDMPCAARAASPVRPSERGAFSPRPLAPKRRGKERRAGLRPPHRRG